MNKYKQMKLYIIAFFAIVVSVLFINKRMEPTRKIEVGSRVPDFSLFDQNGNLFQLATHLGKNNLVIYFYPKDDSPGCTKEACTFRDMYEEFTDTGAEVIGISSDSRKSHSEFATKHNLPFSLLSDEDNAVRRRFGVPAFFFGLLPGRVTYLVDKQGIVQYIFNSQMQTEMHAKESIRILKSMK
jgi:thioredoxin-dependent peroxiredoxin